MIILDVVWSRTSTFSICLSSCLRSAVTVSVDRYFCMDWSYGKCPPVGFLWGSVCVWAVIFISSQPCGITGRSRWWVFPSDIQNKGEQLSSYWCCWSWGRAPSLDAVPSTFSFFFPSVEGCLEHVIAAAGGLKFHASKCMKVPEKCTSLLYFIYVLSWFPWLKFHRVAV